MGFIWEKKTPIKLVSLNRIRYGLVPGLNGMWTMSYYCWFIGI